jgi:hypothetical protein
MISRGGRYLNAWRGGILLRGEIVRRACGGEAGDVGLRADGCAILGAVGGLGGGGDFVGDDSVSLVAPVRKKKKQGSTKFYAWASWGAACCAPTQRVIGADGWR